MQKIFDNTVLTDNVLENNIHIANPIPNWIQKFNETSVNDDSARSIQGSVRYLQFEEQYYLEDHQVTKFIKNIKHATTMQGVEECSKLLIDFHPQDFLVIHEIFVCRNDQKIDKLDTAETHVLRREYQAERNIFSGDLTFSIILNDIKINDIVVFSFSLVYRNEFYVNFFSKLLNLQYGISIYKFYLTVTLDKEKSLNYKFLDQEYEIEWKEDQNHKTLMIIRDFVPPKEIIKYEPYWFWKTSYLQVGVQKTWQDVANGYAQYFKFIEIDDFTLLKLIEEIKSESLANEALILRIFNFINNNIRYFSNYNTVDFMKPTDPNITIKRGYGDCKDLVFLFHVILKMLNVESYPVLVNSTYGKNLHHLLPSIAVFDHAIILIKIDNKDYFIDPTFRQEIDSLEYIFLPRFGYVLVCSQNTENLINIDRHIGCEDSMAVSEEYQIVSWEENDIVFKSNVALTGLPALKLAAHCADDQSKEKLLEMFENFYSRFMVIKKTIKNEIYFSPLKNNQINYKVQYRVSSKNMRENKKNYWLEIIPMDMLEHVLGQFPSQIEEGSGFYYGLPIMVDYQIEFIDSKVKTIKTNKVVVEDEAFIFSKEVCSHPDSGNFNFKYQFKKLKEVIFPDEYSSFLSNYAKIKELLSIVVHKKKRSRSFQKIKSFFYILPAGAVVMSFLVQFCHAIIEEYKLPISMPEIFLVKKRDTDLSGSNLRAKPFDPACQKAWWEDNKAFLKRKEHCEYPP